MLASNDYSIFHFVLATIILLCLGVSYVAMECRFDICFVMGNSTGQKPFLCPDGNVTRRVDCKRKRNPFQ